MDICKYIVRKHMRCYETSSIIKFANTMKRSSNLPGSINLNEKWANTTRIAYHTAEKKKKF
jgi:hypothetical protein